VDIVGHLDRLTNNNDIRDMFTTNHGTIAATPRRTSRPRKVRIDKRRSAGRRLASIVTELTKALGGQLTEARVEQVQRAAELAVLAEQVRARALRGDERAITEIAGIEALAQQARRELGLAAIAKSFRSNG
jgi:hypothetical protein